MATHKQRQQIPVIAMDLTETQPAFDLGHSDGFVDATNGHPRDPAQRFSSWHRRRPVTDYAEYERGYVASYAQVQRFMERTAVTS